MEDVQHFLILCITYHLIKKSSLKTTKRKPQIDKKIQIVHMDVVNTLGNILKSVH